MICFESSMLLLFTIIKWRPATTQKKRGETTKPDKW